LLALLLSFFLLSCLLDFTVILSVCLSLLILLHESVLYTYLQR
jgi:hypothetical protein